MNYPTKKLGKVVEFQYGKGIDRSQRDEHGDVPIYGANGILGWTNKALASGESIIVGRKGSAGEIKRISGKFWPSDVTYYILGNEKIDIDYLFYFLKSVNLPRLAVGVKPGINRNRVYEIDIPVPSVGEQGKIVAKIEKAFAKIDEAARLRAESQEATSQLLPAALHEIFSSTDSKERSEMCLGDIAQFENGDRGENYPGKTHRTETGIPFINAGHLTDDGLDMSDMDYISKERFTMLKAGKVRSGDILFCLRGSLGKVASVGKLTEGAIASSLVIIRPLESVLGEFLLFFLRSNACGNQIERYKNGAAQPNLAVKSLKQFKIFLPPLTEQKKIVKRLGALSQKVRALSELQAKQAADLKALKQSILHKAFAN